MGGVAGVVRRVGVRVGDECAAHVVAPRRARLRAILTSAVARGELPETADLLVAGSFLTGSWYALAVSEPPPPSDWARRVASLVWRGCGGTVPN
ncbi:TetR-like C-terminal domain-containing protein [Intrasporangium oryzae]|uniref:TetR-like C-terminal domain-containing protein n=1 Tax=Intrasporangium oryzae TaxID=412687 RepID=UPI001B7FF096